MSVSERRLRSSKNVNATSKSGALPKTLFDYAAAQHGDELSETQGQGDWRTAIEGFQTVIDRVVNELKGSLKHLEDDLGKAIEFQANRISVCEASIDDNNSKIESLTDRVSTTSEVNKLERMSRRNNFRIVGISESPNEVCEDIFLTMVLPKFADAPQISVERCHRDGKSSAHGPPHILATPTYDPASRWERVKYSIRKESISFSIERARRMRCDERSLLNEIAHLQNVCISDDSVESHRKLDIARCNLKLLNKTKLDGIIVRSRARWVEEGEKSSKYFLNLESRHRAHNVITKLKTDNDEILTENADLLKEIRNYYYKLYDLKYCKPSAFFARLPPFDLDLDLSVCEGQLTLEECYNSGEQTLMIAK
ncbi:hypothetical protein HOLleu_01767 [Holothuria leucospilota]|uniref:Uncharacterized protein n=1 Tax=Holothuria leucospilota TaxID=206669 RepID=A0A9Q1HGM3_HOLLE|nr:hypothetical protein HOLleu_01767 [Holothuria leucospilota]